jgi:hypothetical protein
VLSRTPCLISLCALLAACSSIESAIGLGSDSHVDRPICYNYAAPCVFSCGATDMSTPSLEDCEGTGAISCPTDSVFLSTCPPSSCAQSPPHCCNETTGQLGPPACGGDGFWSDCPAGSHSAPSEDCIPSGFGVSHCGELKGMACTLMGQACSEGSLQPMCWCGPGDAGMVWSCVTSYL